MALCEVNDNQVADTASWVHSASANRSREGKFVFDEGSEALGKCFLWHCFVVVDHLTGPLGEAQQGHTAGGCEEGGGGAY